jgi:hypothetical protein
MPHIHWVARRNKPEIPKDEEVVTLALPPNLIFLFFLFFSPPLNLLPPLLMSSSAWTGRSDTTRKPSEKIEGVTCAPSFQRAGLTEGRGPLYK